MTYFFISVLQTLLPTALLLGCTWSAFSHVNFKKLIWLALLALTVGIAISAFLPNTQITNLSLNTIVLCVVLFCYFSQILRVEILNLFWHFLLLTFATIFWLKDPNVTAITHTDVVNTDFILQLSAVIFGVIFCLFAAAWLYIVLQQYKTGSKSTALYWCLLTAFSLLIISPIIGEILLSLMKLQVIELTKNKLSFVAKSSNITTLFNYISAAILLLLCLLFAGKIHFPRKLAMQAEQHPIEKRKKIALWQNSQRSLLWGIISILFIAGAQLYWDKVASQPPQLSEAFPVKLDQNNQVRIPVEQVKDGQLHRFVWIADDGKAVRFFIINRSETKVNLGVVFDACLLCGDQGYIMQDGQVTCIGCGVRMFIPSIGKPGGCNPVPIDDWKQDENDVIIDRTSLELGLNLFSTVVEIDVIDPVDGSKLKNTKTEFKYVLDNKTYFFASEKNLNLFRDHPENYIHIEGEE